MIEVLAVVCLMNDPNYCTDISLTGQGNIALPYTCIMKGQDALAEWSATRPSWIVKSWHCEEVDTPVKDFFEAATKE